MEIKKRIAHCGLGIVIAIFEVFRDGQSMGKFRSRAEARRWIKEFQNEKV